MIGFAATALGWCVRDPIRTAAIVGCIALGVTAKVYEHQRDSARGDRDQARAALALSEAAGAAQDRKAGEATGDRQSAATEYGNASLDALARVADDRDSLAIGMRRAARALGTCEVSAAADRAAADARALEVARREAEIDEALAAYDAECRADAIVRDFWADLWPTLERTEIR